jgi:hypothetical protein
MSSSGSGTVINHGSGSTSQKVTVPMVPAPVPVPQHWIEGWLFFANLLGCTECTSWLRIRI